MPPYKSPRLARGFARIGILGASLTVLMFAVEAQAACTPAATPGADVITCDAAPPDPSVPPAQLGDGDDVINLVGGTLNGSIGGTGGNDTFNLTGSTLNGVLYGGDGADGSVDTFNLSGGSAGNGTDSIVAERGDDVINIGGAVVLNGRVSGGLGADTILMTGGTVNGSISGEGTSFTAGVGAADVITLSGGTVTGSVSGGDGDDVITVSGATVGGNLTGEAGNDRFVVSGGTIAGVSDATGNNSLTMPVGGTGVITGNVAFGAGRDRVEVASGEIQGRVSQGDGIDDLVVSGGQINEVFQGGDLDTATISGGRIVNGLHDGDVLTITGGRIGFVDMNVANNVVTMSGGQIDGNLTAEQHNDTLNLSGGTIGGFIDFGSGANNLTITGGSVAGALITTGGVDTYVISGGSAAGINAGAGADSVTVSGTGTVGFINGQAGNDTIAVEGGTVTTVDAGDGDDTMRWTGGQLASLTGGIGSDTLLLTGGADLSALTLLDGGDDASEADGWIDTLTFQGVSAEVPNLANWEAVALTQGTELSITPGGADLGGGDVSIDATSSLIGRPGAGGTVAIGGDLDNDGTISSEPPIDIVVAGDVDNSGAIELTGGGSIDVGGDLTNTATGEITAEAPVDIDVAGDLINAGTVDVTDGGTIDVGGAIDNDGGLIISGDNTAVAVTGDVVNDGTIAISGSGNTFDVGGDLINNETLDLTGGDAVVSTVGQVVNTGEILAGGGASVIDAGGGLVNDGVIDMSDGGSGDTLTIVGDVTGSGTLVVDTEITETGGTADTVEIQGALGGTIETVINNQGEPPVAPPQEGSGVTLVTATDGVTATLVLNEPFGYVPIGPWRYELAEDGGEVRLQPRMDTEGGKALAAYTPSAAGAAVAPSAVLAVSELFLPHIRERQAQAQTSPDGTFQAWARVQGQKAELDGKGYDVGYSQRTGLIQFGLGVARPGSNGDLLMAGAAFGAAQGDWEPGLRSAQADLDVEAYAFGLYLTWFQDGAQASGWYGDFVAQLSTFDFKLDAPEAWIADYNGDGTAVSLEVGYLSDRGGWRLEPKARLSYLKSQVDGFVGADGLIAQSNANEQVQGRLAVRASTERTWGEAVVVPNLTLGVVHDFKDDGGVYVGFDRIELNAPRTQAELGAGLDVRVSDRLSVYGELDGRLAEDYWAAALRVGATFRW